MAIVGKWAETQRLAYTTYTDLAAKREVCDLLHREVEKVNETLPAAARIKKFVLLYKELDADDEELTRTRKVRRAFVEERYREVIAALYAEVRRVPLHPRSRLPDVTTTPPPTTPPAARGAGWRR